MNKILICDDSSFMRMMIKEVLKTNEYKTIGEAVNGREGIEKYNELKPDLVLMDLTMPEMNGITALKEIIKNDSQAKIIILSAMGQQDKVDEALSCGAKDFIVKPFKPERLLEAIKKVI